MGVATRSLVQLPFLKKLTFILLRNIVTALRERLSSDAPLLTPRTLRSLLTVIARFGKGGFFQGSSKLGEDTRMPSA